MTYDHYKQALYTTWKTLLEQNVSSLPVQVSKICRAKEIEVYSYAAVWNALEELELTQRAMLCDGFAIIVNKRRMIVYNQQCVPQRCRFTIAHELGHFEQGHVMLPCGPYALVSGPNREPEPATNDSIEQAANVYASRILAPACVLWGIGAHTTEQIATVCNISVQAANFRRMRMDELYRRERLFISTRGKSCFLLSNLEQQVYNQFLPYITEHKL